MPGIDGLRDRLDDVEQRAQLSERGIVVLGEGDTEYPTPAEFEARYGHPPEESDALTITLPASVEGY